MQIGHYNVSALIVLIVSLSFILNWLSTLLSTRFKKFAAPSIASTIGIILFVINQYCWHWSIINPLLIDVPVIEGTYTGTVSIGHVSLSKTEIVPGVKVDIKQTGTSTTMDLYSPGGSHSQSILADLKKANGTWYLYSYYSNENKDKINNRNRFEGASKCEIKETDSTIDVEGIFFNDETRKTYGSVQFQKVK